MKKILLVDDHQLFRSGLQLLLKDNENFQVVAEASNGVEMLEYLDKNSLPDIVLLDISMPVMDGITAAKKALEKYKDLKIITLTMFGEEDYYFSMVELGVKGFLLKNSNIGEVLDALGVVANGGTFFSRELLTSLINNILSNDNVVVTDHNADTLSERELEITIMICKGLTTTEIADELVISKRTVDKHRANILEKTKTKNIAELVVYAIKNKLFQI